MVDQDIVFAKTDSIQRCLGRIKKVTRLDPETLSDIDVQDIVVLNLQRAIQASIDLAAHIVADESWGIPRELRENFDILNSHGIISDGHATRLRKMVGFRNIAVHEYEVINVEILKSILQHHLKDIEEFYTVVLKYFNLV